VVTYALEKAPENMAVRLAVRPLLAFRETHALAHERDALDRRVERGEDRLTVKLALSAPATPPSVPAGAGPVR
jgi:hypothetical protein